MSKARSFVRSCLCLAAVASTLATAKQADPCSEILAQLEAFQLFQRALNAGASAKPNDFLQAFASELKLDQIPEAALKKVPRDGPLIVTANHPFGFADGLAIMAFLEKSRPGEVKLLLNARVLELMPQLTPYAIALDVTSPARQRLLSNHESMQRAQEWVQGGKVLVMFPSGEIAKKLKSGDDEVTEGAWMNTIAKLIESAQASVLPIRVEGALSDQYYDHYRDSPESALMRLPQETAQLGERGFTAHVGDALPASIFSSKTSYSDRAQFLRDYTMSTPAAPAPIRRTTQVVLITPAASRDLKNLIVARAGTEKSEQVGIVVSAKTHPDLAAHLLALRDQEYAGAALSKLSDSTVDPAESFYILVDKQSQEILGGLSYQKPSSGENAYKLAGAFVKEGRRGTNIYAKIFGGFLKSVSSEPNLELFGQMSVPNSYSPLSVSLINAYYAKLADGKRSINGIVPHSNQSRVPETQIKALLESVDSRSDLDALIKTIEPDRKGLPPLFNFYRAIGDYSIHQVGTDVDYGNLDIVISFKPMVNPSPFTRRLIR